MEGKITSKYQYDKLLFAVERYEYTNKQHEEARYYFDHVLREIGLASGIGVWDARQKLQDFLDENSLS